MFFLFVAHNSWTPKLLFHSVDTCKTKNKWSEQKAGKIWKGDVAMQLDNMITAKKY